MKKQELIDKIIEIVLENAEGVNESIIDFKLDILLNEKAINYTHCCTELKDKENDAFDEGYRKGWVVGISVE
jgi:hypothetical protein